jgi:hypothetical protein
MKDCFECRFYAGGGFGCSIRCRKSKAECQFNDYALFEPKKEKKK